MYYVLAFLVGVVVGGICAALVVWERYCAWQRTATQAKAAVAKEKAECQEKVNRANETVAMEEARRQGILNLANATVAEEKARCQEIVNQANKIIAREKDFESRIISYQEIKAENTILKRDLQNIDVHLNKLQIDGQLQGQRQQALDRRSTELAERYLGETIKSLVVSIGPSNFSACKQRLLDVIHRVRAIGFTVPTEEESKLLADLRSEFEREVRAQFQREEQARIKAQIREEERLKREIDRELKQLERERAAVAAALDQALAAANGQHTAEVERLRARLTEAELKSQRAMSMAQQTKAGHVYIISNIGTMGEGVFKVGMTRRLEPQERVDELGSASVPFPYDVHMMVSCSDAPALENAIHRALHKRRLNRVNPRKEFFRSSIDEICRIVRAHHGEVSYVAEPEALQYRQSLTISEEDADYIETVYDAAEDEGNAVSDEA